MTTEKTITLYTFDELPTDKAKDKARDWFRTASGNDEWWDYIYEDAATIGLKISEFDIDRACYCKGKLTLSVTDCIKAILVNHGERCETYKTVEKYKLAFATHAALYPLYGTDESPYDEEGNEALEDEFLKELCEDYLSMLRKEYDYQNSDEVVDENIRCNGYTFREDGKRED